MAITVEEITCKSALTGSGSSYRLNPYVGCEHRCEYCYATYIARWRGKSGPWGSWVQVKTNVPEVLERELARRQGVHIFLSTVCDVYQPVERQYELTRRCLEVLRDAAQQDPGLDVFVLTKSDLIERDVDLFRAFPARALRISFSITTYRDELAALFEPAASPPSRRLAAARGLKWAGISVGLLINPILPYVTEQDLPGLLDIADGIGVESIGFDTLHYLKRHVGAKMRRLYARSGQDVCARLEQARNDPTYDDELRHRFRELAAERGVPLDARF